MTAIPINAGLDRAGKWHRPAPPKPLPNGGALRGLLYALAVEGAVVLVWEGVRLWLK